MSGTLLRRRSRLVLAIVASLLVAACANAPGSSGEFDHRPEAPAEASAGCAGARRPPLHGERRQIVVGDDERGFLVDAPADDPNRPRPVVLVFHGFRGTAVNQRVGTGLVTLAERNDVILVHPEGHEGVHLLDSIGRGWDLAAHETRDLDFVRALLDALERERCVDRRRVYATGMSNGGFFANLVGCRMAERIAAIAPVAGARPLPDCVPARPVPVLLTFGRADDVIPPSLMRTARDWWARVDGCGSGEERDGCTRFAGCELVSCEGPQAHRWPSDATDRIWRFFAAHPRP
jgi:polyhydroxybutyrate depolymerase